MTLKEMKPHVAYRITKGNSDGGLQVGDIVSLATSPKMLVAWIGYSSGAYDEKDLSDSTISDFECEVANDYVICISNYRLSCRKR